MRTRFDLDAPTGAVRNRTAFRSLPGILLISLVAVVVAFLLIGRLTYGHQHERGSGDPQGDALCSLLDRDRQTAPDQLARQVYGDGNFTAAAAGIRHACPTDHGAVAVYLDDTAGYDGTYPLVMPDGYGLSVAQRVY